jgi:uncharacterized OB-fold protein/acyl dehydratase
MSDIDAQKQAFEARIHEYVGRAEGPPVTGEDLVNEPMIRHWCQTLGDENPAYLDPAAAKSSVHGGIVAPPAMLQAWVLPGYPMHDAASLPSNAQRELHAIFDERGYTGVVATDTEQEYVRYLRPGDQVTAETTIESISEEKATALGTGYFILTRTVFSDQNGEDLGWMTFRVLKFKPAQQPAAVAASSAPAKPRRIRSPRGFDNRWWWEGIDQGKLLIQKCSDCGVLRHPPRPMCGKCQSTRWEAVESSGKGTVYSYTVMHHPPIPGYDFPCPVGLIDLEEGTRVVANIAGCSVDDVHVGMRVECRFQDVDEEMKLPFFHPVK